MTWWSGSTPSAERWRRGGYGDRVLCAVFAFEDSQKRPLYWIYNYKRGAFYPFVPAPGAQQRDNERELRCKAQMRTELPVEEELERVVPALGQPDLALSPGSGPRR